MADSGEPCLSTSCPFFPFAAAWWHCAAGEVAVAWRGPAFAWRSCQKLWLLEDGRRVPRWSLPVTSLSASYLGDSSHQGERHNSKLTLLPPTP